MNANEISNRAPQPSNELNDLGTLLSRLATIVDELDGDVLAVRGEVEVLKATVRTILDIIRVFSESQDRINKVIELNICSTKHLVEAVENLTSRVGNMENDERWHKFI